MEQVQGYPPVSQSPPPGASGAALRRLWRPSPVLPCSRPPSLCALQQGRPSRSARHACAACVPAVTEISLSSPHHDTDIEMKAQVNLQWHTFVAQPEKKVQNSKPCISKLYGVRSCKGECGAGAHGGRAASTEPQRGAAGSHAHDPADAAAAAGLTPWQDIIL